MTIQEAPSSPLQRGETEAGLRLPPRPAATQRSVCVPLWAAGRGQGRQARTERALTGPPSGDGCLRSKRSKCRPEKRCGSELSRDRLGRVEWHYLSPLFQKNKSTFLNYTPACIIGITHPRPSARQASIEPGLWPRSINYADKLPVFTGPVWLCTHPPLQAVRKAQTHIYRAAVDWSLPAGHAPPSGYLDKERVGRSRLLSAGVGEGDPYMVSERRLKVSVSPASRTRGREGRPPGTLVLPLTRLRNLG